MASPRHLGLSQCQLIITWNEDAMHGICRCGASIRVYTSCTNVNLGRRFIKCSRSDEGYIMWEWIDPPTCASRRRFFCLMRDEMDELRFSLQKTIEELKFSKKQRQDKVDTVGDKRAYVIFKYVLIIFVVCVMFMVGGGSF